MEIRINPKWQTDIPGEFHVLPGGKIDFKKEAGIVTLPKDYLEFMLFSDGLGTRQRDGWFISQFTEGPVILPLEYLSEMENVIRGTNFRMATFIDRSGPAIPPGFIVIGATENDFKVLLGVDENNADFGKVYAWPDSMDAWMQGNNTKGLGLAGNTFTEFMNSLSARDEL
ncbi:SMI1/KNR4 family protein [Yoonia sp. 2307UL14-13]|uniref:SMI1/KNR4 family protein n=1 Tax=Yoonia sp. 2307UL14-13 TaxID=3126506 RepID=UPI00309ED1F7